jgi:hypothetical protein
MKRSMQVSPNHRAPLNALLSGALRFASNSPIEELRCDLAMNHQVAQYCDTPSDSLISWSPLEVNVF